MQQYQNNEEIVTFLNKAQNKIADLASLLVERGGNLPDALHLLLELSDFIECLDNKYNQWLEEDILAWIHVYNKRANLNAIPFLLLTGFEQTIILGSGSLSLPITTADISDFIPATTALIRATSHNTLKNIQGGSTIERFHLTLAELTFLQNLINPYIAPTVGLDLQTVPNLAIHEKGKVINTLTLSGTYNLNGAKNILAYRYKRIGRTPTDVLLSDTTPNVLPFISREEVRVNTTFSFEVDFEVGGTLSADKQVRFVSPLWFGVALKNSPAFTIQTLTKVVEDNVSTRNFAFTLPSNNTTVPVNAVRVPYILIPTSRGIPSRFEVETFDTKPDWIITPVSATLVDGTTEPYYLCEFKNAVIGNYTFKVFWT